MTKLSKTLSIHRAVLASYSNLFKSIFQEITSLDNHCKILLPDIEYSGMSSSHVFTKFLKKYSYIFFIKGTHELSFQSTLVCFCWLIYIGSCIVLLYMLVHTAYWNEQYMSQDWLVHILGRAVHG